MEQYFKKYNIIFLIVILALAVFFRFYQLKTIPPGLYPDEAMNGNNALEAIHNNDYKVFYPENNGREGLFINIQALSVRIFGNEPWALRIVSAIFGVFTVLGLYLLTKELFNKELLALLTSFFLAVSFWHINFSRIGFRAIMAPFFLVWGLWLVWKLLGSGASKWKLSFLAILAGFVFGLGFHSYISYRIAPVLLIIPFWSLIKNKKFLLIILFIIGFLVAIYPLVNYFYHNPQDFLGRTTQISIFSASSPVLALGKNILLTVGMFFVYGDGNWRHNIAGVPELWWPVAILFLIGFIISVKNWRVPQYSLLVAWLVVLLIPVIVSNEGIPHSLRSIIVVPVVMIFVSIGLCWLAEKINRPKLIFLIFIFLLAVSINAYKQYFLDWAGNPNVASAFNENYTQLGNYLKYSSPDIKKYVIINTESEKIDFMPMPVQPVMFLTDTYSLQQQKKKNIFYVLPKDFGDFIIKARREENFQIFMLKNDNLMRGRFLDNISGLFTYENGGILIQQK
ncbi:MAG: glycosyltransferase family 39 protein [Candidatus Parcubacteria bacterium]|nr:glycosyltransferase family 39 protein [Candidatus Parcubacteria bacterium]